MRLLRSLFFLLLVAAALVSIVSASWDKDDFEIFELQNALEKDEGQGTTFYSILNLTRSASINDIRKAYRARSKELHPDKHPHDSKATKRFERLGVINKILRDERRDRYDHFLTNGFPRWRGTGYYYSRFRPSLAFVLLFIIAATSGVQLLIKMINWRRDVSRLESLRTTAKIMAWGPRFRFFDERLKQGDPLDFTVVHTEKRVRIPLSSFYELPPFAKKPDGEIDWEEDEKNVRKAISKGASSTTSTGERATGPRMIDAKVTKDNVFICEPGTKDNWLPLDVDSGAPRPTIRDTWAVGLVLNSLSKIGMGPKAATEEVGAGQMNEEVEKAVATATSDSNSNGNGSSTSAKKRKGGKKK